MRNSNVLTTALPTLTPVMVVDSKTGELLTVDEWQKPVHKLLNYVQAATRKTYGKHSVRLLDEVERFRGSANSYGRQLGYRIDYSKLPPKVLAKSRIQELYLHNLISGTANHVANLTETKQAPDFPALVNLGSVDSQMVTLSEDGGTLQLDWKVWDRHLTFFFETPAYILKYEILKWCLPTVRKNQDGNPVFNFTIQEPFTPNPPSRVKVGIDWGVTKPYTVAVMNRNNKPAAVYNPSKKLAQMVTRKERLVTQKMGVTNKIVRLEKHYPNHVKLPTLHQQKLELTRKIVNVGKTIAKQAGYEITAKLAKHNASVVKVENLTWVTGTKNSKTGSNHSFQHARLLQAATHSLARAGVRVRRINPRNTSQDCHKCGQQVIHDTKKREVKCQPCQVKLDRDFNAAINIAKKPLPGNRPGGGASKTAKKVVPAQAAYAAQSFKPLQTVRTTT